MISTEHTSATDLSFLLHKHPDNVGNVAFPFGDAHLVFPEAGDQRCAAAVLVEADPIGLIHRQGRGTECSIAGELLPRVHDCVIGGRTTVTGPVGARL